MSDEHAEAHEWMAETLDGKLKLFQLGQAPSIYECSVIQCDYKDDRGSNFQSYYKDQAEENGLVEFVVGIKDSHDGNHKTDIGKIRIPKERFGFIDYNFYLNPSRLAVVDWGDVPQFMAAKIGKWWFRIHPLEPGPQD